MSKKYKDLKEKSKKTFEAHLVTLGDGQVGKTSIIIRYIDNSFSTNYLSTIGIDSKIKKVVLSNGEEIKVKISDTAGQERFKSIASNYMKKANGVVLVYDITSRASFQGIDKWISEISGDSTTLKPMILIGNKADMETGRVISVQEGEDLAKKYGEGIHFYETSCKTGDNVDKAISDLVNQIYNKFSGKTLNENNIEIKKDKNNEKDNQKKKCC